jgi:hypothetical protein
MATLTGDVTMPRAWIVGSAMVGVLVLTVAWSLREAAVGQERRAQPLQGWEYKVVDVAPLAVNQTEATFNRLGSEGWELCATVVPFRRADEEYVVSFIFKRPKR